MRERFAQIRTLLDELEQEAEDGPASSERALVSGLELPDIIRDVVDFLLPELKPYEASIYLYMLRHSVVETGSQLIRVSRRGLRSGVVKSAYSDRPSGKESDSAAAAYKTIQTALEGLEATGAIRREADPNREGTLFRVLLPEEIEVCRRAREAHATVVLSTAINGEREIDYYNIRENLAKVYERDICMYCRKQLTRFTATLDHVHPVAAGGDNSLSNLVTACLECNSKKNVRPLGDFLAEKV